MSWPLPNPNLKIFRGYTQIPLEGVYSTAHIRLLLSKVSCTTSYLSTDFVICHSHICNHQIFQNNLKLLSLILSGSVWIYTYQMRNFG